jgi:hypothetical protein
MVMKFFVVIVAGLVLAGVGTGCATYRYEHSGSTMDETKKTADGVVRTISYNNKGTEWGRPPEQKVIVNNYYNPPQSQYSERGWGDNGSPVCVPRAPSARALIGGLLPQTDEESTVEIVKSLGSPNKAPKGKEEKEKANETSLSNTVGMATVTVGHPAVDPESTLRRP